MRQQLILAAMVGLSLIGIAQPQEGETSLISSYAPAVYDPGPGLRGMERLVVFPAGGEALDIPLPFGLSSIAYSPDGKALYAPRSFDPGGENTGLYRIEFDPVRASLIASSAGLYNIDGIAASRTAVVFSGGYRRPAECGMYELTLANGKLRKVVDNSDCKFLSGWQSISLSPDGDRAVAVRKGRLELVDLAVGTTKSLGDGFDAAAWSPDGLWVAALEYRGRYRTVLLDTSSFERRRELPNSNVVWSPDSRYLLAGRTTAGCNPEWGTIAMMDVGSGKLTTIQSSHCKVRDGRLGWVSLAGR
jgi:WD40 repeat protein